MRDSDFLVVRNLMIHYQIERGSMWRGSATVLRAVEDVSFEIGKGETFGLVGESGCGKSSIGRALLRLQEPTSGTITLGGTDITTLGKEQLRQFRQRMQMVFQDSLSSLNPYMKVAEIIREPLDVFRIGTRAERRGRVDDLLRAVGLEPAVGRRFPHEFSGGQRQRINIARALVVRPAFVVCDEPVSALDVTIQAQIVELLADLQQKFGPTYLFISHDLAVVREVCHRVAIMYLGSLCEIADSDAVYASPLHPYTRALISAIPIPDPALERRRQRIVLAGDIPSAVNPPPGCRFAGRCPSRETVRDQHGIDCATVRPLLAAVNGSHRVACHLYAQSRAV
jgi:oligopeptide transport system ATP-binding protein